MPQYPVALPQQPLALAPEQMFEKMGRKDIVGTGVVQRDAIGEIVMNKDMATEQPAVFRFGVVAVGPGQAIGQAVEHGRQPGDECVGAAIDVDPPQRHR